MRQNETKLEVAAADDDGGVGVGGGYCEAGDEVKNGVAVGYDENGRRQWGWWW
jgi:hypothetical protein